MNILKILTPKRILGNKGELAAAKFLKASGYKILKRNYVALNGEIDIIAKNESTVVFVEVKSRTLGKESPKEARPASAVTPQKQRGIIKAAKCFLTRQKQSGRVRFDVIEVFFEENGKLSKINHLQNTFNADTAKERGNFK